MGKFDKIYASSPVWMQNLFVSAYGVYWHWLRFGGSYRAHFRSFQENEHYSTEEWQKFQHKKLSELIEVCVNHVPYYRDTWSDKEKQQGMLGNLEALPLLEKDPIREDPFRLCRDDAKPIPKLVFHTSGTTGTPIKSIWTISELRNSLALREARSANWAGVSFADPRATFSGRLVEPNPESFEHVYRYNAAEKQVYFSAFHLTPKTARLYVDALRKHHVVWMTGYAVSFYLLAKFILDQELEVPPLKAVITTSEKLTTEMRKVMQDAYECRIYEEYSTVENAVFASECEHGRLHVSPDVGIVEILHPDGSICAPGEIGEVIATCLFRNYQPLIRFRLGDLATWDPTPCPCGRNMPVIKEVVGRIEDVIIGPDGRQLVRFHGIFVDQPHVLEGQIIQEDLYDIIARVVPTKDFDQDDVVNIQQRIAQRLGHQIRVKVELVDAIERTSAGKFKAVISKITSSK